MLIRWKAAVVKEEGARGKHTQTHPHRPADITHGRHTYAPKERAHLFLRESREKMQPSRLCKIILVPLSIVTRAGNAKKIYITYMVKERIRISVEFCLRKDG